MKISSAGIIMTSRHSSEKLDVSVSEKTSRRETLASRTGITRLPAGGSPGQVLVDRVRLSSQTRDESAFSYQGELTSRSTVVSADEDTVTEYQNKAMVETLVGAVIDKDVVVGRLKRGESVSLGTPDSAVSGDASGGITTSRSWEMALNRTDIHYEDEQMGFSSAGTVTTEDGRTIDFSLDIALDRMYLSKTEQQTLVQVWQEQVSLTDPLVVNLEGGLPSLSDTTFEFDLNADGRTEQVHFAGQGSGFLAFDKNMDGTINDGSELFGPGTGNGFGELADFDTDGNNWIDENDAVFEQLSVWTRDENGEDRLISLKDAGIGAIALDHVQSQFDVTGADNSLQGRVRSSGVFLFENGNVGAVQQIDLADRTTSLEAQQVRPGDILLENGIPVLAAGTSISSQVQPAENPLDQLLDRVNELRRQMEELLNPDRSGRRFFGDSYKGFGPSSYQLHRMTVPDPFTGFENQGRMWA